MCPGHLRQVAVRHRHGEKTRLTDQNVARECEKNDDVSQLTTSLLQILYIDDSLQ